MKKLLSNKAFYGIVALVIVIVGVLLLNHQSKSSPTAQKTSSLTSLNAGPAPWLPEYAHLSDRLAAINLPLLGEEGTALHIHTHLDIYVHGKQVAVPAEIGVPPAGGITPIHTHDTTGIIHVESPDAHATYTLSQFFDIWGVKLTASALGSYASTSTQKLTAYANGTPVSDPTKLDLKAHEEIVLVYGTPQEIPSIPASYDFPDSL